MLAVGSLSPFAGSGGCRYPVSVSVGISERYYRATECITRRLVEAYNPERILLFGSVARGDVGEDSDIDLIIVKQTVKRPSERAVEARLLLDRGLPIDIVVYTPKEFAERSASGDPIFRQILAEARTLYDARAA